MPFYMKGFRHDENTAFKRMVTINILNLVKYIFIFYKICFLNLFNICVNIFNNNRNNIFNDDTSLFSKIRIIIWIRI